MRSLLGKNHCLCTTFSWFCQQWLLKRLIRCFQLLCHKYHVLLLALIGLQELELLLDTNALTHQMLCEYVSLDPFNSLLREANQSVNLPHGRITLHCFWEINTDFMPSWVYNSTTNRYCVLLDGCCFLRSLCGFDLLSGKKSCFGSESLQKSHHLGVKFVLFGLQLEEKDGRVGAVLHSGRCLAPV